MITFQIRFLSQNISIFINSNFDRGFYDTTSFKILSATSGYKYFESVSKLAKSKAAWSDFMTNLIYAKNGSFI